MNQCHMANLGLSQKNSHMWFIVSLIKLIEEKRTVKGVKDLKGVRQSAFNEVERSIRFTTLSQKSLLILFLSLRLFFCCNDDNKNDSHFSLLSTWPCFLWFAVMDFEWKENRRDGVRWLLEKRNCKRDDSFLGWSEKNKQKIELCGKILFWLKGLKVNVKFTKNYCLPPFYCASITFKWNQGLIVFLMYNLNFLNALLLSVFVSKFNLVLEFLYSI